MPLGQRGKQSVLRQRRHVVVVGKLRQMKLVNSGLLAGNPTHSGNPSLVQTFLGRPVNRFRWVLPLIRGYSSI